jgi:hypothetical protein
MRSAALLLLMLSASPALAQDAGGSSSQAQGSSSQQGDAKKTKKVIRLDTLTVEGRIQKPQAFYILQRSNLSFDDLNRTESFVPKVVKSVEKEPF